MRADLNAVQGMVPVLVDHTFRAQKVGIEAVCAAVFGVWGAFLRRARRTPQLSHIALALLSQKFREILVDVWYPLQ
jgi:hypothetical protein